MGKETVTKKETQDVIIEAKKRDRYKIIIFNIINLLLIVSTLFLSSRLPSEATKTQELRSQKLASAEVADAAVLNAEIERFTPEIEKISSYFIDENGFLDFIVALDQLKAQGVLVDFSFTSPVPVVDKQKNYGYPIALTLRGTQEQIDDTYRQLHQLPYLIKTILVSLSLPQGDNQLLTLTYNGFLYVDEKFKN